MNNWGYTIYINEKEFISDFGYETESDADDAMRKYITDNPITAKNHRIVVEQKWIDL